MFKLYFNHSFLDCYCFKSLPIDLNSSIGVHLMSDELAGE